MSPFLQLALALAIILLAAKLAGYLAIRLHRPGGDRPGENDDGQRRSVPGENVAQFFQRPRHAFLGRVFGHLQRGGNFPGRLVFKVAQHQRCADCHATHGTTPPDRARCATTRRRSIGRAIVNSSIAEPAPSEARDRRKVPDFMAIPRILLKDLALVGVRAGPDRRSPGAARIAAGDIVVIVQ